LTVFTSTVYPDIVRVWNACIRSALPREDIRVEVFSDTAEDRLEERLVPGAVVLRRTSVRRDFHDAYNDALARAETPYLAFVDTDVFWLSPTVWPHALDELERPEVAAVSCVSRRGRNTPGTFAVIMKANVYRSVLADFPGGFDPAIEGIDATIPPDQWTYFDTGDRAARAVVEAGYEIRILNLDEQGAFVRFDGLTMTRRAVDWIGPENFLKVSATSSYHWVGLAGNVVLKRLHDRLFADGMPYDFPFSPGDALYKTFGAGRRTLCSRLARLARVVSGAYQIRRRLS
jgi:hypothetical protein